MSKTSADQPDVHYDNITKAWRHLMGESFHYGYFVSPEQELNAATEALTREMARAARLEPDHRVLDVGCGIGGPALYLTQSIGCRVTGISTSYVGIATARERAASVELVDRAEFLLRDGMDNGFDAESFDRVWVMESSHLMADKGAMIRDSARVLERGGRLVLCDIIMRRDLGMSEVLKRAREFDLLRRVFGRAKMETLASYESWCREAGLRVNRLDEINAQTRRTFDRWQQNAAQYRGEVVALIGEESHSDFVRACDELKKMWSEEVLGYGILEAEKPR